MASVVNSRFHFIAPYKNSAGILETSSHSSPRRLQYLKREIIFHKRIKHQNYPLPAKRATTIKAVAVAPAPTSIDTDEYRKKLANSYGFKQIGEPLPENIKLKDIIDSLPKEVFEINNLKAWRTVLVSVTSYTLGLVMIAKSPWYLLPLAWAWTGTTVAGLFVLGHDCAHKSFSKNKVLENIVGTLAFLPTLYPFESWRFQHDLHHAKTNMLREDTAWFPIIKEETDLLPLPFKSFIYGYGPLRPWMSIVHWWLWHFDMKKFKPNEINRVKMSIACSFSFMLIGWPLIIYKAGIVGWVNFFLIPWLGFHFWLSTCTMIHRTAPHIPYKPKEEWNAAQAQLNGTVHCDYPPWIETLCHDINVHIPHHISTRIPSYNLRAAHNSLRQNWGKYLNLATFNWRLMKTIMTKCHIYSKEKNYISFDELLDPEDTYPITLLRKVMPNFP